MVGDVFSSVVADKPRFYIMMEVLSDNVEKGHREFAPGGPAMRSQRRDISGLAEIEAGRAWGLSAVSVRASAYATSSRAGG